MLDGGRRGSQAAQSLGLHLEETLLRLQSIREQELVKKVWSGCVLMDRAVCMTLG